MNREIIASAVLLLALALIAAGAFAFGWRIGCIVTGLTLLTALRLVCRGFDS